MTIQKILVAGLIAGLVMGIALFITGAIASFVVYGPQFTPPDKFEPEQVNAWYFFWTKLMIGCFFGLFFSIIYSKISFSVGSEGALRGLFYGFLLWLIIALWSISHPLVYGPINVPDKVFWLIYTMGGFLAYGSTLGYVNKRMNGKIGQNKVEEFS